MPEITNPSVSFDKTIVVDDLAKRSSKRKLGKGVVTGLLYTNPNPTPAALGGVPEGETFLNKTMQEMWDELLYPYIAPEIVLSVPGGTVLLREKGDTLPNLALTATVTKHSEDIASVTFYRNAVLDYTVPAPTPGSNSYVWGGTAPITDNLAFTAKVTDTPTGTTVTSNTISFNFVYPYFYGVAAPGRTGQQLYTAFNVGGKIVQAEADSTTRAFSPTAQVYYFMYPAAYAGLTHIYDKNGFDYNINQADPAKDWSIRIESVTGLNGIPQLYRIYEFTHLTTQVAFNNTFVK